MPESGFDTRHAVYPQTGAIDSTASREKIEFTIRAGLAQGHYGQSTVELESIIAVTKHYQKEIARFRCDAGGGKAI